MTKKDRSKLLPAHLRSKRPCHQPPVGPRSLLATQSDYEGWRQKVFQYFLDERAELIGVFEGYLEFLGAKVTAENLPYLVDLAEREVPAMRRQDQPSGRPQRWTGEDGLSLLIGVYSLQLDDSNLSDRSAASKVFEQRGWVAADPYRAFKTAKKSHQGIVRFVSELLRSIR